MPADRRVIPSVPGAPNRRAAESSLATNSRASSTRPSRASATAAIERQLDRFAPGFRDLVLGRRIAGPASIEERNPNYVGGDIGCGSFSGLQAVARPVLRRVPYATPNPAIYLCSAATPPGPGVHGMCGANAAAEALRYLHREKC